MKKSWGLIPKILSGEKTIESRWYQTRRTPWDRIAAGDKVFFKNSGEAITVRADVSRVLQFEIENLRDIEAIVKKYGERICLINKNPKTWGKLPYYCVLVFLENARGVKPCYISKAGFGSAAAWITIKDIGKIATRS